MGFSDIGVYGLGVMGRNLALNFNEHEHAVSVFNKRLPGEEDVVEEFLSKYAGGTSIRGFKNLKEWVDSLRKPRVILLMVKAGPPVDMVIDEILPHLDPGDIIVDGGNSHFKDTNQRVQRLSSSGIRYIGMGISGGEKGARRGPSMMPGGDKGAWPRVKPLFQSIAAKEGKSPCCRWMGPEGAGHFVKMVHNGIEYAIMQALAECYQLMSSGMKMSNEEISGAFDSWNSGLLKSYLMEITAEIFTVKDTDDNFVIDLILDKAGQKGTGRWTALTALEMGIPMPLITEAVFARSLSSFKDLRGMAASGGESGLTKEGDVGKKKSFIGADKEGSLLELEAPVLRDALLGAKAVAFAEGFWLLQAANEEYDWNISYAEVAKVWQEGCIIRSSLLESIAEAYEDHPELPHLLLAPVFKDVTQDIQHHWRMTVSSAIESAIPVPALSAALSHHDSLLTKRLPANLIQAQRDFFGAHTYERLDKPRGNFFHTNWQKDV